MSPVNCNGALLETPHPLSDLATHWVPHSTTAMVCVAIGWVWAALLYRRRILPWLTPWKEKAMRTTKEMRWLMGGWKLAEGDLHCATLPQL